MKMHWIDWSVIVFLLGSLLIITLYARKYMKSVADFLAANRLAGRYMLTVSSGFGGAISIIAAWEMVYNSGLPTQWWGMIGIPIGLIIGISGFITYRFRQTRALTLAQFFEVRYSRQFRYFAGFLCWISGVFNYGIFPLITARVIIYFFGLPEHFHLGTFEMPTLPLVMAAYLSIALFIACTGGQISIMIADFTRVSC
jgi:SSS family solute:Na+ symporter